MYVTSHSESTGGSKPVFAEQECTRSTFCTSACGATAEGTKTPELVEPRQGMMVFREAPQAEPGAVLLTTLKRAHSNYSSMQSFLTFHNIYIAAAEIQGQIHWRPLGTERWQLCLVAFTNLPMKISS